MKNSILFSASVLIAFFCCKNDFTSDPFFLNKPIELKYGEIKKNADYQISIVLDSVLNDSRCPTGAQCIWAGNAAVRFIYCSENSKVSFVLNTISSFRTDSLIDGYRIRMIKLSPYPGLGVEIKQSDYKAEIEVKKQ